MARDKRCPRCAESVKAEAQVCRYCGYEFPPPTVRGSASTNVPKGCAIAVVGFIALGIIGSIASHSGSANSAAANSGEPLSPADTALAVAAESKSKEAAEKRSVLALGAGKALKDSMRNPDSLIVEGAWSNDDGSVLCVSYRAQNGFGGMNRDHLAYDNGRPRQGAGWWNKHCARHDLNDVTSEVKTGASFS